MRHNGDVSLERVEIRIQILAIDCHVSLVCGHARTQCGEQSRLARTTWPKQAHKFTWLNDEANVVKNCQLLTAVPIFYDTRQVTTGQLNIVDARMRAKCCAIKGECIRPNINSISPADSDGRRDSHSVHIGSICTVEIRDLREAIMEGNLCMHTRHLNMRQMNGNTIFVASNKHLTFKGNVMPQCDIFIVSTISGEDGAITVFRKWNRTNLSGLFLDAFKHFCSAETRVVTFKVEKLTRSRLNQCPMLKWLKTRQLQTIAIGRTI